MSRDSSSGDPIHWLPEFKCKAHYTPEMIALLGLPPDTPVLEVPPKSPKPTDGSAQPPQQSKSDGPPKQD
jgi:hypothetical protein